MGPLNSTDTVMRIQRVLWERKQAKTKTRNEAMAKMEASLALATFAGKAKQRREK